MLDKLFAKATWYTRDSANFFRWQEVFTLTFTDRFSILNWLLFRVTRDETRALPLFRSSALPLFRSFASFHGQATG
jgi:hypothetical protein